MDVQELLQIVRLISGFVFKSVFGDRPDLCRRLLEITLNIQVSEVTVRQVEKELDLVVDKAGGRLDLYAVDSDGNHYDVEVQAYLGGDEPLRARRYQALMDAARLKRGAKASDLRKSVVVFICDFDPFEDNLKRYDFEMVCAQTGRPMGDGRFATFLNIKGTHGAVTPELDALLQLFAGKVVDNDPFVEQIIEEMQKCVKEPEWMEHYMNFEEEKEIVRRAAQREGHRIGFNAGHKKGYDEGMTAGYDEGRTAGYDEGTRGVNEENALLVKALREAGRIDELADALLDEDRKRSLLKELGITS